MGQRKDLRNIKKIKRTNSKGKTGDVQKLRIRKSVDSSMPMQDFVVQQKLTYIIKQLYSNKKRNYVN